MKTMISYWRACTLLCGGMLVSPVWAQGLGNVSQSNQQGTEAPKVGQSYVDTSSGETPNPQVLGMEIPLLDPASNTMTYNGAKIDVGNNELHIICFAFFNLISATIPQPFFGLPPGGSWMRSRLKESAFQ